MNTRKIKFTVYTCTYIRFNHRLNKKILYISAKIEAVSYLHIVFLQTAGKRQWRHGVTDILSDCREPWLILTPFKIMWRSVAQCNYGNVNYITFQRLDSGLFSKYTKNVHVNIYVYRNRNYLKTVTNKQKRNKICKSICYREMTDIERWPFIDAHIPVHTVELQWLEHLWDHEN